MDNLSLEILGAMYEYKYDTDEYDYLTVDRFYSFLGYNLELENVLQKLEIYCTSDLQEKLLHR